MYMYRERALHKELKNQSIHFTLQLLSGKAVFKTGRLE